MMVQKELPKILYIEKPSVVGGTITGLYETIRGLIAKGNFEPVMLFHGPNPYREKFKELNVQTIVLDETPPAPPVPSTRDIGKSIGRYSSALATAYRLARKSQLVWRKDRPLAQRVSQIIKDEAIDLVHHNNHLVSNRDTILGARFAGVPQVCHVRMLTEFDAVERWIGRSVDRFVYMSTAIEKQYQALGVPSSQGQVVYDSFEFGTRSQKEDHNELRQEFGLCENDYVISNVGRFDWWKGQDYFIKAMKQVVQSYSNTKALLVGEPDQTPKSVAHYDKMQQLLKELDLTNNVIITGFRSDVPQIMAASDLIVHSASEPEPFGRVVVEAMAAQRPIIATAAGGVLDIVTDQVTGLLVPPKDDDAMGRAILNLIEDKDRGKRMGELGQEDVASRFSVERHINQIE
ncbi:MAG: glycosyltransferase, partial [Chloroflexota bacterium]